MGCYDHGEARDAEEPRYRLVREPSWEDQDEKDWPTRLEHACVCGRWTSFDYGECFRGMGFVAGKTPPRGFHDVIFAAELPSHVARHLYDTIRRRHADALRDEGWERYFDDFEAPTRAELREVLDGLRKGHLCIDNERVAEKGKPRQMRRYRQQQAKGCCGSLDVEVQLHGRTFLVGLNYGH